MTSTLTSRSAETFCGLRLASRLIGAPFSINLSPRIQVRGSRNYRTSVVHSQLDRSLEQHIMRSSTLLRYGPRPYAAISQLLLLVHLHLHLRQQLTFHLPLLWHSQTTALRFRYWEAWSLHMESLPTSSTRTLFSPS